LPPVAPWLGGWKRRTKPSTGFARSTPNLELSTLSIFGHFVDGRIKKDYMERLRKAGLPE